MTKEQWIRHMEEASGLLRPSNENGCMADQWKEAIRFHKEVNPNCPECKERRKTKRNNANVKARHEAYTSCGLVRVRGALGGIYYE